jgi:hypothetical protein
VGFDFLDRVRKTSVAVGLVVSLAVWAYRGIWPAAAFAVGCAWSIANVHVIRILVLTVTSDAKRRKLRIAAALFFKVPILYAAGYVLLLTGRFPPAWLLLGFSWPLTVVILKAAGRLVLGLDAKRGPLGPAETGTARKGT